MPVHERVVHVARRERYMGAPGDAEGSAEPLVACQQRNLYPVRMPNRPESRHDQAWQIFLTLLASRQPDENPFHLAQDAFRAADAFEKIRHDQERDIPPEPSEERRGF